MFEDQILHEEGDICIVCKQHFGTNKPMATLKYEELMIPLCCPICFDKYNENPKSYANFFRLREVTRPDKKQ